MAAKNGRRSVITIVGLTTLAWIVIDIALLYAMDNFRGFEEDTRQENIHPKHNHHTTAGMEGNNRLEMLLKKRQQQQEHDFHFGNKVDLLMPSVSSVSRSVHDLKFEPRLSSITKLPSRLAAHSSESETRMELLPNKMRNELVHNERPNFVESRDLENTRRSNIDERFEKTIEEEVKDSDSAAVTVDPALLEAEFPPLFQVIRDYEVSPPQRRDDPGAFGRGLKTGPREAEAVKRGYEEARFNQYVSDKISVQRRLTDVRPKLCKESQYAYNKLPVVSVIICFTEESWSPLLRTVHSVLNRTPPRLLEEIILLDDASQRDHLKKPLDEYMAKLDKVRIVRMKERQGLIRARLAAIKLSRASVLVFLDSHIECSVGWLEPMLDRVWRNKGTVVQPVIDNISMDDFRYNAASESSRGSFKWSMEFTWETTPMEILSKRDNKTVPISTPTIAGGLFIIDKHFFKQIGQYDEGLEVWGVENLELSFKTWMCHGRLEISPCSHIGHIFRNSQPYKFPGGAANVILHNAHRVAMTFLGPYIEIFYQQYPSLRKRLDGDVTGRRMILARNKCHDFDWYLRTVHSHLHIPEVKPKAGNRLMNLGVGRCLDSNSDRSLILYQCHGQGGAQYFALTRSDTLEQVAKCVHVHQAENVHRVYMATCTLIRSVAKWQHEKNGAMKHTGSGLCLDVDADNKPCLRPCSGAPSQKWNFDRYS